MAFSQTLTLDDLQKWAHKAGADLQSANLEPPLKTCAVLIKADIRDNFQGSHGPDGAPWPGLAHPRVTGGDKPLEDSGLLAASTSSMGKGHIENISQNELTLGTNLEQAALQQYGHPGIVPKSAKMLAIPLTREAKRAGTARRFPGTLHAVVNAGKGVLLDDEDVAQYALTVGPIKVPARPFAGFSTQVIDKIQKVFLEFFANLVR